MYIDPEVYTYDALSEEHKRVVDGYDEACAEVESFDPEEALDLDPGTLLGQLIAELAGGVLARVRLTLDACRTELIAKLLDEELNE